MVEAPTEYFDMVRDRWKITDLITLCNVKLTLRGEGGVSWPWVWDWRWAKMRKNQRKGKKINNWCLNKKCITSANVLFYNIHGGRYGKTVKLVAFSMESCRYKWCVHRQMIYWDVMIIFSCLTWTVSMHFGDELFNCSKGNFNIQSLKTVLK